MNEKDALVIIESWFKNNCDGIWEHQKGFALTTTDNPGWMAVIDKDFSLDYFIKIKKEIADLWDADCIQNKDSLRVYSKTIYGCISASAHILNNATSPHKTRSF
jgi:hypothetical protein